MADKFSVSIPVDTALVARGLVDRQTRMNELTTPTAGPIVAALESTDYGVQCTETKTGTVGQYAVSVVDTFSGEPPVDGRCVGVLADRRYRAEGANRAYDLRASPFGDAIMIANSAPRDASGSFNFVTGADAVFTQFSQAASAWLLQSNVAASSFPVAGERFPTVPAVGRMTGKEDIQTILASAKEISATSAQARALVHRMGDLIVNVLGLPPDLGSGVKVEFSAFYDTKGTGKIDAYRLLVDFGSGPKIHIVDIRAPLGIVYRLVGSPGEKSTSAMKLRDDPSTGRTSTILKPVGESWELGEPNRSQLTYRRSDKQATSARTDIFEKGKGQITTELNQPE